MKKFLWCLLGICFSLSIAWAEDRALLVTLADYADETANLPGLEQNLILMQDVLTKLNFKKQQIKLLTDDQATSRGIVAAFEDWLITDVEPDDRVVFYYSGHGYQVRDLNGDEDDGCDEALVAYDLIAITDDKLSVLFKRVRAKEVLVIIDSCFSGTIVRSLGNDVKSMLWPLFKATECGKPVNVRSLGVFEEPSPEIYAPIGLTAAAQNEVSLSLGHGSAFTLALHETVMQASDGASFLEIRDDTAAWIRERINQSNSAYEPHTPQVFGPETWLEKDFFAFGNLSTQKNTLDTYEGEIENAESADDLFSRIVDSKHFRVSLVSDAEKYQLGQRINLTITSSKEGYLNIIELGPNGDMTVVFPNEFNSDNYVAAEEVIKVPSTKVGGFRFEAIKPLGQSRLLALVTSEPLNLMMEGPGSMQGHFKTMRPNSFKPLSGVLTRGVGVFKENTKNLEQNNKLSDSKNKDSLEENEEQDSLEQNEVQDVEDTNNALDEIEQDNDSKDNTIVTDSIKEHGAADITVEITN